MSLAGRNLSSLHKFFIGGIMNSKKRNVFYIIEKQVEFWPEKRALISCATGEKHIIFKTASYCFSTLINNKPQIVSQKKLIEDGWGESAKEVPANTFYQSILNLRRKLKEAGLEHDIIKTIPRKGLKISDKTIVEIKISSPDLPQRSVAKETVINYNEGELKSWDAEKLISSKLIKLCDVEDTENNGLLRRTHSNTCPYFKSLYLFFIIILIALFLNKLTEQMGKANFMSGYKREGSKHVKSCTFYLNADSIIFTRHEKFIKEKYSDCSNLKNIYVSTYLHSSQVSVFQCRFNAGLYGKQYCSSFFYSSY